MSSSSSSSPEIQSAPTADTAERFTYKHATHEEVLEDLSSRFLLNLPEEELSSLERICFQVEQAHWFYEDFVREQNPKFPSLPLKRFSEMLFHACPLLHQWSHDHEQAFSTFMQYKTRVPVCGAIMLNESWEKCILVKGWKSSSGWGFPKGKINEHEPPPECAVREVLEETGYNLAGKIDPADVIEMSIKEQLISLFIVPGIPDDFPFKTRTRKEISRIEWFKLTDLPTWKRNKALPGKFYLISPFIAALKAFITARKPRALGARNPKGISYAIGDSGQQESSSSSADIGEPQTPSSQSSETALAPHDPSLVAHRSDDEKALLSGSVDPHFTRLMNSLSLSVKKADAEPPTALPISHPPISEASHKLVYRHSRPAIPLLHNPIRSMDEFSVSDLPAVHPAKSPLVPINHVHFPNMSALQDAHSDRLNPLASSLSPGTPAAPSLASISASSSISTPSPLSFSPKYPCSSRRSSSTADISPYLTRPTEVPTSGKRLKQLALLELVADESSKMVPVSMNREVPVVQTRDNFPGRHPGACASVPPPSTYDMPNERRDPTFSRPGALIHNSRSARIPSAHCLFQYPSITDILQVRPLSGQHIRHGASVTTSRDRVAQQNQLLSLLGGHSEVAANGELYHVPEHFGVQPSPYFHPSAPPIPSPYSSPFPPHLAAPTIPTLPGARAPLTMQTTLSPPSSTAQLLSILNSGSREPVPPGYPTPVGASTQAR
ncbi:Dcp2, box A domain-containing protein [Scleroderma yunnanense]